MNTAYVIGFCNRHRDSIVKHSIVLQASIVTYGLLFAFRDDYTELTSWLLRALPLSLMGLAALLTTLYLTRKPIKPVHRRKRNRGTRN